MTRHVWSHQRKVTPFAGGGSYSTRTYDGWGYGYYRRYRDPQRAAENLHRAVIERCLRTGPATVADHARPSYWARRISTGSHVRRVDEHGRTYGPRLLVIGKSAISTLGHKLHLVEAPDGRKFHLRHDARVRIVARQAEDLHSAACRALKAQWRLTRNDTTE